MRASSAPIEGPGVRRLEAGLGARDPLRPAALPPAPLQEAHGNPPRDDHGGPGQQVMGILQDPRASQLGLGQLQHAVRRSFKVLQHALGGGSRGQGLLDPLLRGHDVGGQGGPVLTDHRTRGRGCLSPMIGQTQGTAGNPFWSTGGQQALPDGPSLSHAVPVQQLALSPAAVEVEKIRERVPREAEQNFARELQKLEKGDSASYG